MNPTEWLRLAGWWLILLPAAVLALGAAVVLVVVWIFHPTAITDVGTALSAIFILAVTGGVGAIFAFVLIRETRRILRQAKMRVWQNCCQKCGYNLTGNVSGVCPECGTAIDKSSATGRP